MKKLYKFLGIITIGAVIGLTVMGCVTYQPVDVTNTMAAQFEAIKFYTPQPGEEVKTLYVNRTGSFVRDLNSLEGGVWYSNHQEKLVSIEAVAAIGNYGLWVSRKDQWRIEYVD
ncbi:hypothetical protein FACS1894142_7320 [Spirochaetia bacterium]|nr:hypothetical protein FACS1894142_7320 [Spirochaetia bacterium]